MDLPEHGDWDELPEEMKLTRERVQELLDSGAPAIFERYRELLSQPLGERCAFAARGLGGFYWPCARPVLPGERYCFAHGGRSPEAAPLEREAANPTGPISRVKDVVRRLIAIGRTS